MKHAEGADPAAVAFDAVSAAKARGSDVVLIDTAGRLQTKVNLMEELAKISRVVKKVIPDAPHQTILVLDATTGQNAVSQAQNFGEIVPLTGVVLTKLDGTAKGGVVLSIHEELHVPIRWIGLGEREDDLQRFNALEFAKALFETEDHILSQSNKSLKIQTHISFKIVSFCYSLVRIQFFILVKILFSPDSGEFFVLYNQKTNETKGMKVRTGPHNIN